RSSARTSGRRRCTVRSARRGARRCRAGRSSAPRPPLQPEIREQKPIAEIDRDGEGREHSELKLWRLVESDIGAADLVAARRQNKKRILEFAFHHRLLARVIDLEFLRRPLRAEEPTAVRLRDLPLVVLELRLIYDGAVAGEKLVTVVAPLADGRKSRAGGNG